MAKKIIITIALLTILAQVFASVFTFEAEEGTDFKIKLKIKQAENGLFELDKAELKVKKNTVTLTEDSLKVNAGKWIFAFTAKGGGKAGLDFKKLTISTELITTKDTSAKAEHNNYFYQSRQLKSNRHYLTELTLKDSENEIKIQNHIDKKYGMYTDLQLKLKFNVAAMKVEITKNNQDSEKTKIKITNGAMGFSYNREKSAPPVYGGTAREEKKEILAFIETKHLTVQSLNTTNTQKDTQTKKTTELTIKLKTDAVEAQAKTIFNRTQGTQYLFKEGEFKLKIKISKKTEIGTLSLEFNEDRSIKVSLSSKISDTGSGKFRLTGDIDS